jgi:photosystem II stability/assembly factor-like uncharacterized protein
MRGNRSKVGNRVRRALKVASATLLLAIGSYSKAALDPLDPLMLPAVPGAHAASSVLTAVARAGRSVVAAGESGIIFRSDDNGASWSQARVPVSVTLTALSFPTAAKGWAVGHSGVILATVDGGATWKKQIDGFEIARRVAEPAAGAPVGGSDLPSVESHPADPLLDVYFSDERNGFAVGAFGLLLRTRDGGETWVPWQSHVPNSEGNHLYAIGASATALYIVGERGAAFVSKDGGESFARLETPYEGSLFGLSALSGGNLLVYGLRGRIMVFHSREQQWRQVGTPVDNAWTGSTSLLDGRVLLGDQAGEWVLCGVDAESCTRVGGKWPPVSGALALSDGEVLVVGPKGAAVIPLAALGKQAATR